MENTFFNQIFQPQETLFPVTSGLVLVLLIWSLIWKGAALWHASKNEEKIWFIAILIINIFSLLEIAYLFLFSQDRITSDKAISNVKVFINSFSKTRSSKKANRQK